MAHQNAFKPNVPAADLTKLPEHIRQAFDAPVPYREGEVGARVMTMRRMGNIPNGRFYVERIFDTDDQREAIALRAFDFKGIDTLVQVEITPDSAKVLLRQLMRVAQASGADLSELASEFGLAKPVAP